MNAQLVLGPAVLDVLPRNAPVTRIRLLGITEIRIDNVDVTSRIKYRKGIALLALLSVECNVMHQRDRIADSLWPDLPLSAARSNLRQVLSNLVKVLEPGAPHDQPIIRASAGAIGLYTGNAVDIDVVKAQANCEALSGKSEVLFKNFNDFEAVFSSDHDVNKRFLDGFELSDCTGFMEWLGHQRQFFHDLLITLYEDISDRAMATGDLDRALVFIRKAVLIDPLLEANQLRLVRLLASLGRREQALRELNTFIARVRNELDVDPGSETLTLREQVMQGLFLPEPHFNDQRPAHEKSRWVTVLYAACCPLENDPTVRNRMSRQSREEAAEILRSHGAYVVRPPGRGVFAYFGWSEDQRNCAKNALDGAKKVLAGVSAAEHVMIGIYSCQKSFDNPGELDELGECSDIAYRLSLAAEGREIVVCEDTLQKVQAKTEKIRLGQLRGILETITLFRILC